jgi:hypothetical protein
VLPSSGWSDGYLTLAAGKGRGSAHHCAVTVFLFFCHLALQTKGLSNDHQQNIENN